MYFEAEGKDGRKCGIAVNANEPIEEHVTIFLQNPADLFDKYDNHHLYSKTAAPFEGNGRLQNF